MTARGTGRRNCSIFFRDREKLQYLEGQGETAVATVTAKKLHDC